MMKVEENQNKCYQKTPHHQLKIVLSEQQGQESISISLNNKETFDVYELTIDDTFFKRPQMKELAYLFPTPRLLFEELKEIIGCITIFENGVIKFDIVFGRSGIKQIKIQLVKKQIEKIVFLLQRMNEMKQEFKGEIASVRTDYNKYMYDMKREQSAGIDELSKQLGRANKEIQHLKTVIQYQGEVIKEVEEVAQSGGKVRRKKQQRQVKEKLIQKITQKLAKPHKRRPRMEVISSDSQNPVPQQQIAICEKDTGITARQLTDHSNKPKGQLFHKFSLEQLSPLESPFLHYFHCEPARDGITLTKRESCGFFNYIPKLPIPAGTVTRLVIRQLRTKENYIMTGICTPAARYLYDAFYNEQAMAYYSLTGWIYKDGGHERTGTRVADGSAIAIEVDLLSNTVEWTVNDRDKQRCEISQNLLGKEIHFVVMMAHRDDQVRLMSQ